VTGEWLLTQLDRATGKVVWKEAVLTAPIEPIHRKNSRASTTPATPWESRRCELFGRGADVCGG
jgi:hypothetical protein